MVEAFGIMALAVVLFALGCYCGIKLALHDLGDDCPESSDPDKETPPDGWDGEAVSILDRRAGK